MRSSGQAMNGASRSTGVALLLLLAAACTTRPLDSGRNKGAGGINLTGADAGAGAVDTASASDVAQGQDAQRDEIARDIAEFLVCTSDDDCVVTWHTRAVMSEADCYCFICS